MCSMNFPAADKTGPTLWNDKDYLRNFFNEILQLHHYSSIFIAYIVQCLSVAFFNYFFFNQNDPYCQLKRSHPTTHYECKFIYECIAIMRIKLHALFTCSPARRSQRPHFVIKHENETNIVMLQCYLSFLSDQRKKPFSAKLFMKKRERERTTEWERKSERTSSTRMKNCNLREWTREIERGRDEREWGRKWQR